MSTKNEESTGQVQRAPPTFIQSPTAHIFETLENSVPNNMGVASVLSKRRLESSSLDIINSPTPSKVPRKAETDCPDERCSSEFLTTSILARTLLTSVQATSNQSSLNPLECLKSSLEALPAPTFLESLEELTGSGCGSSNLLSPMPKLTTIRSSESNEDVEFDSLLCSEAVVTVLSPIDENGCNNSNWSSGLSPITIGAFDQVITKEENGKSYFNLGPSDTTLLAKKSSPIPNYPTDQNEWSSNNNDYLDEASSSSSCESISSEDLFNSCEEYDDDDQSDEEEDEVRTYKQRRSQVLHLSLCKLNSFRTQSCVEPSLHRSVLICNTLRQIEQEIRNEDEAATFLRTKEKLPPFWPTRNSNPIPPPPPPISHIEGNTSSANTNNGNNSSYLNSYTNDLPYSNNNIEHPPTYENYNCSSIDRPSETPFHTTSYDYAEIPVSNFTDLGIGSTTSNSALLECDSGYTEDINLSMLPFYYSSSGVPQIDFGLPSITTYLTIPDYSNELRTNENPSILPPLESLQQVLLKSPPEHSDINSLDSSLEISNSSSDSSSSSTDESTDSWSGTSPQSAVIIPFSQRESNCGMQSLRKDYNFNCSTQHPPQLPMDTLISNSYSST